ncbi:hypothetical protein [Hyphobacterium marinum]|uniref:Uncharacterized protein n=1 Tax=Hyphobacterium marinum TaxID=3116574 RepID=A0ABU7M1J5_9PROT|nr:hypothetical protein [Hyphobacterium sp. Y6023]MEE2567694.1 hypothetical protein [Hyphobacterium sp. Y6023]
MATRAILIVTAVLIAVTGLGFAAAAGYIAAADAVGPLAAAGLIAGVLLLVAFALVIAERIVAKTDTQEEESPANDAAGTALTLARTAIRENPVQAMALVSTLGFLAARRPGAAALLIERVSKYL